MGMFFGDISIEWIITGSIMEKKTHYDPIGWFRIRKEYIGLQGFQIERITSSY